MIRVLIFLLLLGGTALPNSAAPHYRFPGGQSILVFPGDSSAVSQVYLKYERIHVQLFNGYAVVYGRYVFAKTTDTPLSFTMGYPVFGELEPPYRKGRKQYESYPDTPHHFRCFINGTQVDTNRVVTDSLRVDSIPDYWLTWPMQIAGDSVVCEVYFMVPTAEGLFRRGYSKEEQNGFAYILTSGGVWPKPIGSGDIYIQMMDKLTADNVWGMEPDKFSKSQDGKWLHWHFEELIPDWTDNVLIRYEGEKGLMPESPDDLYKAIAATTMNIKGKWLPFEGKPIHHVSDGAGATAVGIIFFLLFYGPYILLFLVVALVAYFWWRIRKRKKKKANRAP